MSGGGRIALGGALLAAVAAGRTPASEGTPLVIRAAKILTMAGPPIEDGGVVAKGGKIEAVGPWERIAIPEGARVIDVRPNWAMPGIVEAHSHVGGLDWNDMVQPTNPGMRIRDSVVRDSPWLRHAIAGGVTTILFLPGSGTNLSGWGVVMKTAGRTPEEMIVRAPGALKIAQAGNPERRAGDLGYGRMGMNWIIRECLRRGRAYVEARRAYERGERPEPPAPSIEFEDFPKVVDGEIPAAMHTQWYQVVLSTLRIVHDEAGIEPLIDHATFGAYRVAPEVARRGLRVANGPRQLWYDRRKGEIVGLAAGWYRGGVREICVNTDAPVVPEEELFFQAAVACGMGLPPEVALRAITIHPARALKIDDRVGSLEPGKDADVAVVTGDPLDPRNHVTHVLVNGRLAYEADRGRRF